MRYSASLLAKLLILATFLVVSGCSDAPKEPVDISYSNGGVEQPISSAKPASRGFFRKKLKNLFTRQNTVWERMLSLYAMPEYNNERIDQELSWYLSHPDYIARIQERAAPYIHLILDEIEAKNLPGELALLPAVESAFIPEAYSRSAASGLWQFIPATGRLYGLEQNSWYDGRRDVYASTVAATTFLKDLGEEFNGDYCLALASYNYGKGNIGKAIMRNEYSGLPTDYWSLSLPKETMDYVPRLLAVAKLFANAEAYNIKLQNIPNKAYCEVVNVGSQLDLDKAAELANTPLGHIMKLNPGFKKATTSPYGPHHLLIPKDRVPSFKKNLAQLPYYERVNQRRVEEDLLADKIRENEIIAKKTREEEDRAENQRRREIISSNRYYHGSSSTQNYKVRNGESLTYIAQKYGTTVSAIKQTNHMARSSVNAGSYLKVPVSQNASIRAVSKEKGKASNSQVYTVKKGDTFFNISKRFAVSRSDIASWNKISPNSNVRLGQRLVIKGGTQQYASAAPSHLMRYTVKRGDSLMQISRKFGVSVGDLKKSNPGAGGGIRPGQSLKILVDNNRAT
jgi:membrane-bound lytic murein transglycosylase D